MVHRFLYWVYERLTLSSHPEPADLIFVLAGKMERKRYGLGLYDAGLAKGLLLSVGRFEVSKMDTLHLPFVEELIAKRNETPPEQRHFFVEMDQHGTQIALPMLLRWNTYGEALGLKEYFGDELPKKIIIVSTDIHLRRIALTLRRVFLGSGVQFRYCPVPQPQSSVSKDLWWTRREDRRYVISEMVKLSSYQAILLLPDSIIRCCMGLNSSASTQ